MSLHDIDIASLIPHAGSMCVLDGVEHFDAQRIACRASSHRDLHNPLRSANQLSVQAGIEYAAQAVAVHGALLTQQKAAETVTPQQGMIAVLTDVRWQVERLDDLTADLLIHAERLAELPQGLHYQFSLHAESRTLLEGELIIALQPAVAA